MSVESLSLAEISACLLDLHEGARSHDFRPMQRFVFERTSRLIPLDGALIAHGTIRDGVPVVYDTLLHRMPPELMESWERVKTSDVGAYLATSSPGKTFLVDVDSPIFDDRPEARAHCEAFGIGHMLVTALVAPIAGLFSFLSLYRHPGSRFTESERLATEALTPHVFDAIRQARLGQLRRTAELLDLHGQVAAITTRDGVLLEAEQGFVEHVALEWRDFRGPLLPPPLRLGASRTGETRVFESIVANVSAVGDLVLVHVRRPLPADRLTEREREVARAFSLGETHRELGERLGISPNTVRRHLANIYEKLGIASKVELDRMISGVN